MPLCQFDSLPLAAQIINLSEPMFTAAPVVGQGNGLLRLVGLMGAPGRKVNIAHGPQGLNEIKLAAVKGVKDFVAFQEEFNLVITLLPVAGQQHPQIVHSRAVGHIIKIKEKK